MTQIWSHSELNNTVDDLRRPLLQEYTDWTVLST